MNKRTKTFRIIAWGHPFYPDLDYESDVDDREVYGCYPCNSVALQIAIPYSAVDALLDQENAGA